MKKIFVLGVLILSVCSMAQAGTVALKGKAASDFIQIYFPNASVPGSFQGNFKYFDESGKEKQGYAVCYYPAMGAQSDGAVPTCTVSF